MKYRVKELLASFNVEVWSEERKEWLPSTIEGTPFHLRKGYPTGILLHSFKTYTDAYAVAKLLKQGPKYHEV